VGLRARGWPDTDEKAAVAWLAVAQQQARAGQPFAAHVDRSIAVLDDVVRQFPADANGWVNRAIACESVAGLTAHVGGDAAPWTQRALRDLEQALALEPGAARVLHTRGALRVRLGLSLLATPTAAREALDGAIADFTAAVTANPQYVLAWLGRCQAHRVRSRLAAPLGFAPVPDLRRSVADAEQAVAIADDTTEALEQRAACLAALADQLLNGGEDARPWFERALADRAVLAAAAPNDAQRQLDLGVAHLGVAQSTAAQGAATDGLWESALAALERAAALAPDHPVVPRRVGQVQLLAALDRQRAGVDPAPRLAAALAALDRAVELGPQDARAILWRAKVHWVRRDRAAALADLAAAERLRPGHPEQARMRRVWGG